MSDLKVVSIANRSIGQDAREYAVFLRVAGDSVEFKLLGEKMSASDKQEVAEACEAMAKALRKPKY
jgi:hypothetical protein